MRLIDDKALDAPGLAHLWRRIKELVKASIPTKLSDLTDDKDFVTNNSLSNIAYTKSEVNDLLEDKENKIVDLDSIRAGAAAGATAVQRETDPTVPAWAKQPTKPSYTASEIGALDTTALATYLEENGYSTGGSSGGTIQAITFNGTQATIDSETHTAAINVSIPSAPGFLNTNNSSAQNLSSSEPLTGNINLHRVSKTGISTHLRDTDKIVYTNINQTTGDGIWGDKKFTGDVTFYTTKEADKKLILQSNSIFKARYVTVNNIQMAGFEFKDMSNNHSGLMQSWPNSNKLYYGVEVDGNAIGAHTGDWKVGIRYVAKGDDNNWYKFQLWAPPRYGGPNNNDVLDAYIPVTVNGIAADNTGNIALTIPDVSNKQNKSLIINIDIDDTELPLGTYNSITAALAAGQEVVVIENDGDAINFYLPLNTDGLNDDGLYCFSACPDGITTRIVEIYGDDHLTIRSSEAVSPSHSHGSINNAGQLISDTTIGSGDKLVFTDSDQSDEIRRSSISFDGSTTTKALTQKGTWETFYQKPQNGIPATDLESGVIPDTSGKADKVQSATNGHLAGLNASGNLTDSGIVPSTLVYQGVNEGSVSPASFDPETDTVHVTQQSLSSSQQAQARENIGVVDVSGTNDGTNWTSITIGSTTKAIPSGGGGGGEANVIESISINGTSQTVTSKNVDLPVPTSTAVYQIVSISQSAYDALVSGGTVSSTTLYLITS